MKKRSLALFLAFLLVFAAVLPVFATTPEEAPEQEEEQNPTYTYADMYVQEGLQYRWDAYDLESIEGTELTMTDKDGREVALTLADVVYNSEYKVPETVSPIDFSSLVPKGENGEYLWNELEFELVMTQTSYTGSGEPGTSPYINLGPFTCYQDDPIAPEHVSLEVPGWADGDVFNPTYGGYAGIQLKILLAHVTNATFDFGEEGSVAVPTRKTNMLYVQSFTGGQLGRWYGNTIGQSYSFGAAMTFTLPEDSMAGVMNLVLFRDRVDARSGTEISGIPVFDICYVPGKTAIQIGKIADEANAPTSYEQALEFANRDIAENVFLKDLEGPEFRVGGVNGGTTLKVGYHAFRVYNRLLTDAERQQNHFADLCSYHKIDAEKVAAYMTLSDDYKAAIYSQTQFCGTGGWFGPTMNLNTSFDDVTKEQIEAAIDEQVLLAEEDQAAQNAKFEKLAGLYVDGYSALWSAYGAKSIFDGTTDGVIFKGEGAEFTYAANEGGTAAYGDGYLRLVNGTLTVSNAYTNETGDYTTEMIYASYDAQRERNYAADFTIENAPVFAEKVDNVFTVWGMNEDLSFTDAKGKAMQEEWAKNYLLVNNDEVMQTSFWMPISQAHYQLAVNGGLQTYRQVGGESGNEPYADYSMTGYEADFSLGNTVLAAKPTFYHGYYYVSQQYEGMADSYAFGDSSVYVKPGIGNSYVMKSEFERNGVTEAHDEYNGELRLVTDFSNWGPELGNWSRYDFGVVTSHTWEETVFVDETKTNPNRYKFNTYGDDQLIYAIPAQALGTPSTDFIVNGFDADYYAIRIYPFVLSEAQKLQNHFADLVNYVEIDNVDAFLALSEEGKQALYAQFAETTFADADKAVIEDTIQTALLDEIGVTAESFLAFEGYQMTVHTEPTMRATFSVKTPTVEGVELKELGIGVAMGNFDPVYTIIYDGVEYANTRTEGENVYASLPMSLRMSKTMLETELTFSGYVVFTYNGVDYTFNCDMTSEAFGESVSMYELACHDALKDLDNAIEIRSIVEVEAE